LSLAPDIRKSTPAERLGADRAKIREFQRWEKQLRLPSPPKGNPQAGAGRLAGADRVLQDCGPCLMMIRLPISGG
jgi:hypothetical protein